MWNKTLALKDIEKIFPFKMSEQYFGNTSIKVQFQWHIRPMTLSKTKGIEIVRISPSLTFWTWWSIRKGLNWRDHTQIGVCLQTCSVVQKLVYPRSAFPVVLSLCSGSGYWHKRSKRIENYLEIRLDWVCTWERVNGDRKHGNCRADLVTEREIGQTE